jgi:hypothetical protein
MLVDYANAWAEISFSRDSGINRVGLHDGAQLRVAADVPVAARGRAARRHGERPRRGGSGLLALASLALASLALRLLLRTAAVCVGCWWLYRWSARYRRGRGARGSALGAAPLLPSA